MRKIVTSVCGLLLMGAMNAQSVGDQIQVPSVAVRGESFESSIGVLNPANRGSAFFMEDFANGFDGNNGGIGAWDPQDSGGDTPIWMVATSASPAGQYSNTSQALNSTTKANGWIIYDSDLWNTPTIVGATQGFLVSPSIDCSDKETVIVEWQQAFRYCCQSASPLTLGVSSDGGATWTEFPAQGDFIQSANTFSGTNLPTAVDISCAATNQADVKIRFSYNESFDSSYSHYFWGIDDIIMYENPTVNDLRINQVSNGDVFNIWEYRITPIQQAPTDANGGLLVRTMYENVGSADQTGVTITAEVLDAGGAVLNTTTSEPFDLPGNYNAAVCPNKEDTLDLVTNWVPGAIGDYSIRVTIASEQDQDVPEDDVVIKTIEYTDCMMGHDELSLIDVELQPRDSDTPGLFENTGYGCYYTAENAGSVAKGALVRFGPNTDIEYEIELRFYTILTGETVNDATYQTTAYELTEDDIPANAASAFSVYIPFDDEVDLEAFDYDNGQPAYFLAITNDEESSSALTVMAQNFSDSDNSTAYIRESSTNEFIWFGNQQATPFIRLVMDDEDCVVTGPDAVEEFFALNVSLSQNVPNPANGMTTINYTLEEAMKLNFQVVDNNGRVVYNKGLGMVNSGQHNFELNTSNFAAGIYQYSLISGNSKVTKTMVVK